jgi:hypothetical protein
MSHVPTNLCLSGKRFVNRSAGLFCDKFFLIHTQLQNNKREEKYIINLFSYLLGVPNNISAMCQLNEFWFFWKGTKKLYTSCKIDYKQKQIYENEPKQ